MSITIKHPEVRFELPFETIPEVKVNATLTMQQNPIVFDPLVAVLLKADGTEMGRATFLPLSEVPTVLIARDLDGSYLIFTKVETKVLTYRHASAIQVLNFSVAL